MFAKGQNKLCATEEMKYKIDIKRKAIMIDAFAAYKDAVECEVRENAMELKASFMDNIERLDYQLKAKINEKMIKEGFSAPYRLNDDDFIAIGSPKTEAYFNSRNER